MVIIGELILGLQCHDVSVFNLKLAKLWSALPPSIHRQSSTPIYTKISLKTSTRALWWEGTRNDTLVHAAGVTLSRIQILNFAMRTRIFIWSHAYYITTSTRFFFLLKIYIYTFRNQQRTYTQVQFYTRRQFSYYTGREREKVDEKITNTNRDWFHGFL